MFPVLALVLIFLSQGQPPPALPAQPEELQFAWPAELEARVETERTRQREQDGKPQPGTRTPASYRMRVSSHPDGRVIRFADFKFDEAPGRDGGAIAEAATALLPTMIVSPTGSFLRAEDTGALKSILQTLTGSMTPQSGETPSGLKDLVERLASDQFIVRMTAQEWDMIVGAWIGTPVSKTRVEFETEQPTQLWSDVKVPMVISVAMTEERDCSRAGTVRRCGVFELISKVDQAGMALLMKRLLEGMKDMADLKYEAFDVVTTTTLETELLTMVPHSFEMVRTTSLTFASKTDGRTSMKQVDRRTQRYVYSK